MGHEGKAVLVTGGGGGLGRALAEHFLELGCNVVICDINKELLADFEEKVTSAHPDRALAVQCNVTSEDALDDLFTQAEKKFGHFDYVINSAGVSLMRRCCSRHRRLLLACVGRASKLLTDMLTFCAVL